MLPKCPYCGNTNIKGAEAEYMEKQSDFAWKQENLDTFDEVYDQGDDEKLMEMYYEAASDGRPVYEWDHANYSSALAHYKDMEYVWAKIERGEPPMSVSDYAGLLSGYFFIEYYYNRMNEEKKERYLMRPVKNM